MRLSFLLFSKNHHTRINFFEKGFPVFFVHSDDSAKTKSTSISPISERSSSVMSTDFVGKRVELLQAQHGRKSFPLKKKMLEQNSLKFHILLVINDFFFLLILTVTETPGCMVMVPVFVEEEFSPSLFYSRA